MASIIGIALQIISNFVFTVTVYSYLHEWTVC